MSINDREASLVRELGEAIGYGRLMQLAEQTWHEYAQANKLTGSEHTVGPCAAFMVPCQCVEEAEPELDANGHCEWCCGAQRVTKFVRGVQLEGIGPRPA